MKLMVICSLALFFVGCASSQMKQRKEAREKVSQTSKLYCDFVNGELYPDVEIVLNLEMAKKCDSEKNFSITQYKTSNENNGVMYCCALTGAPAKAAEEEK